MLHVPDTTPSNGHITFATNQHTGQVYEFYLRDGEIWKAPIDNVIDVHTGYRIGRWEGPVHYWACIQRVWGITIEIE